MPVVGHAQSRQYTGCICAGIDGDAVAMDLGRLNDRMPMHHDGTMVGGAGQKILSYPGQIQIVLQRKRHIRADARVSEYDAGHRVCRRQAVQQLHMLFRDVAAQ